MARRKIIRIDESLCNGCGQCIPNCHEGALRIVDGKARLVSEQLCDGLGACLGHCPMNAITIEEREAEAYDECAVQAAKQEVKPLACAPAESGIHARAGAAAHPAAGCPGTAAQGWKREPEAETGPQPSQLTHWPVQLHLVSPTAPYYKDADLLLAADCTAYALGGFHAEWLKGRSLAIACPKLDEGQEEYLQKLVALIDEARIRSLTVLIMQVPCCRGLAALAEEALARATRKIPLRVVTVGLRGEIVS